MAGRGARRRRTLCGCETEYAVTARGGDGRPLERMAVTADLVSLAARRYPCLCGEPSFDLFLGNGARLYRDSGLNLCNAEYSTPECPSPEALVAHVRAGDRIVAQLAEALAGERDDIDSVFVSKCNVDYLGHTSGSHENYLLQRRAQSALEQDLVPHLVSRIVYTGAGGFDDRSPALRFSLSPRVQHLERVASYGAQSGRGIFTLRPGEQHAGAGFDRLHLLCGDGLRCELAEYLRFGATALIVLLADFGHAPGRGMALRDPLDAMRRIAADPTVRIRVRLRDGGEVSAIDIQRHYLAYVENRLAGHRMPAWGELLCRRWRAVLDALEQDPSRLVGKLDWSTKLMLYRRHAERRRLDWRELRRYNAVLRSLCDTRWRATLVRALGPGLARRLRRSGETSFVRARKALSQHDLTLPDIEAFLRVRDELFELDIRWGELGTGSLFTELEQLAVIRALVPKSEITQAIDVAPRHSRAHRRAEAIRRLCPRGERFVCNWERIVDGDTGACLDLSNPLASRASPRWPAPG